MSKYYFGAEIDKAVIEYNTTTSEGERRRLFEKIIYPALTELVQNIIYDAVKKERPYYSSVSYDDLKHECICYLYSKMEGFDPGRGKAFSYFNHIGIMWMIAQSQTVYKDTKSRIEMDEVDNRRNLPQEEEYDDLKYELKEFVELWIKRCRSRLFKLFNKEIDIKIADAILNIFENREYIDIYKKSALYILVKEQVDAPTHRITLVVKQMQKMYLNMHKSYLQKTEKEK